MRITPFYNSRPTVGRYRTLIETTDRSDTRDVPRLGVVPLGVAIKQSQAVERWFSESTLSGVR